MCGERVRRVSVRVGSRSVSVSVLDIGGCFVLWWILVGSGGGGYGERLWLNGVRTGLRPIRLCIVRR